MRRGTYREGRSVKREGTMKGTEWERNEMEREKRRGTR